MAVLARSGLQLLFNQMLQAIEPSCLAEQGFQRLCFAQQRSGRSGWRGAQRHGGDPAVALAGHKLSRSPVAFSVQAVRVDCRVDCFAV